MKRNDSGRTPITTSVSPRCSTAAARSAGEGEQRPAAGQLDDELVADSRHPAGDRVHRWAPDELRHEQVGRARVDRVRRADLLQHAAAHHHDPVAHRHRLDLVVRHVQDRRRQAALQLHELRAHLHPQLGVEVGERLVHQEHRGPAHDRAGECDALPLPTREFRGLAIEILAEVEARRHFTHALVAFGRGNLAGPQRELDVAPHRQVRVRARSSGTPSRCRGLWLPRR